MSTKKTLLLGAGALAATAIVVSSLVYANRDGNEEQNDAAALAQAKISLTQAIAAAEQKVNGKAVRAGLEDENGKLVYGVEVMNGDKPTDVKVDIATGAILSAQADQADHEGDENGNEGGDNGRESGHDK
jgi:uncharacterized membrane protein YkoI